jgi:hypothetical protein
MTDTVLSCFMSPCHVASAYQVSAVTFLVSSLGKRRHGLQATSVACPDVLLALVKSELMEHEREP